MTQESRTESFLDTNPLKDLVGIPPEVLRECSRTAYELFQQRRWSDTVVMCRGLLAADPGDAYAHRLLAGALLRLGQLPEALAQAELGLKHAPDDDGLKRSRAAIVDAIRLFEVLRDRAVALKASASGSKVSPFASSKEVQ